MVRIQDFYFTSLLTFSPISQRVIHGSWWEYVEDWYRWVCAIWCNLKETVGPLAEVFEIWLASYFFYFTKFLENSDRSGFGPLTSPLLSSLPGFGRLATVPPPSPNHFTLRLSSFCNWTEFDLLPFLFLSFCLLFPFLSPFRGSSLCLSLLPVMLYIRCFDKKKTIKPSSVCSLSPLLSLALCSSTVLCVINLCSKSEVKCRGRDEVGG